MTDHQPGDTVTVTFDGLDHPGIIERHERGWYTCRIHIDPEADYGSITARLAPDPTVCVRERNIHAAET